MSSVDVASAGQGLRDIRGPSALGSRDRRFWRLLWHMAVTDFRLKYHGSVFGYVWSLVSPLLLFGVLYLAFTRIVRFGADVENYAVVLLFNIMMFQFFAEATNRSMMSMVSNESVVRKMEFPRLVLPLSIILASTFTLLLDLVVVAAYAVIAGAGPLSTWALLPVLVIWLYVITLGTSLLLSTLYIRFRDTAQIWSVVSRVLFYGSPVLFPIERFPAGWKAILLLNPLAPLFAQARVWLVEPTAPTFASALGGSVYWIYPILAMITIVVLGIWFFDRDAPRLAEEL